MRIEELKQASDLQVQIEKTEKLLVKYRDAKLVFVATGYEGPLRQPENPITLTADEVGGLIVTVLERRIAATKEELRQLGVE
jgi:hypothetical protein